MGVRTALPKTELPFQIRRQLSDWERDAGMLPQLATFASFTIAAEVWPRIVETNPRERLTLQHGARVIYIHEPNHYILCFTCS